MKDEKIYVSGTDLSTICFDNPFQSIGALVLKRRLHYRPPATLIMNIGAILEPLCKKQILEKLGFDHINDFQSGIYKNTTDDLYVTLQYDFWNEEDRVLVEFKTIGAEKFHNNLSTPISSHIYQLFLQCYCLKPVKTYIVYYLRETCEIFFFKVEGFNNTLSDKILNRAKSFIRWINEDKLKEITYKNKVYNTEEMEKEYIELCKKKRKIELIYESYGKNFPSTFEADTIDKWMDYKEVIKTKLDKSKMDMDRIF